jgi:transcriptional regulator with XRE-family HTH domain
MDQVRLGRQLENLRAQAGLTREALGEKLTISPMTIGRIEDGDRPASMEVILAWAAACGQHVSFQFSATAGGEDAKVGEILKEWKELADEDRQRVLRFAKAVKEAKKGWKELADNHINAVIAPRVGTNAPEPQMPTWTAPTRSIPPPPAPSDESERVLERLRARTAERATEREIRPDEEDTVEESRSFFVSLISRLGGDKR